MHIVKLNEIISNLYYELDWNKTKREEILIAPFKILNQSNNLYQLTNNQLYKYKNIYPESGAD